MTHLDKAKELRQQGYNCAQSVLIPFASELGLDESTAARITMGLGAGVGGQREICGVANGMAMALSLRYAPDPALKGKVSVEVRTLTERFRSCHGCLRCSDLKALGKDCNTLVFSGVKMLEEYLAAHPQPNSGDA